MTYRHSAAGMALSLLAWYSMGIAALPNAGRAEERTKKPEKKAPQFKNVLEATQHLQGLWVMSPEKTLKANDKDAMAAHIANEAKKSGLEVARDIPLDGFYYNRLKQNGQLLQNDAVKLVIMRARSNRIELSSGEFLQFDSHDEMKWEKDGEVMVFVRKAKDKEKDKKSDKTRSSRSGDEIRLLPRRIETRLISASRAAVNPLGAIDVRLKQRPGS